MNNINSIYEVTKEKTRIKGFWKDDKGKVYIDNIKLYFPQDSLDFEGKLSYLFAKGEVCVFVRGRNKAFIQYPLTDHIIELTNLTTLERERLSFQEIKDLLNKYNGLTIFKSYKGYLIELWTN